MLCSPVGERRCVASRKYELSLSLSFGVDFPALVLRVLAGGKGRRRRVAFMESVAEVVLAGSAVHVQWHRGVGGWRVLTGTDAARHEAGTVGPVSWRQWSGDLSSVITMALPRRRDGVRERWWILAGELPSPDAVVVPVTGDLPEPAVRLVEGRLWACEWSGDPSAATVTVGGRLAVAVDLRSRPYFALAPVPSSPALGYRRGWFGSAREAGR
jgi:hypothetical protein